MEIQFSGRALLRAYVVILAALLLGHIAGQFSRFGLGYDYLLGLVPLLSFYEEANLPTWISGQLLFTAAVVLFLIARNVRLRDGKSASYWLGLAAIFLFLSADEIADIHALVGSLVARKTDLQDSFMKSLWVLPYAALTATVGLIYLRFLLGLPRRTAILFVISGVGYAFGAVGLEVIEGRYMFGGGTFGLYYMVLVTIEELLEMGSVLLFLGACLDFQRQRFGDLRITLTS